MITNQPPIVAHGLVRHFGAVKAVDGVDLEVHEGEIFGFLGPNGAGKSTVIRMLTTLLKPTSGSAQVAGFDVVTQANDVRRNIGVALQDAAIDPLMTGNELLRLQAVLYGLPVAQVKPRADELLERVGLIGAGRSSCRHLLGWDAPPPRSGAEPDPPADSAVPRRTDYGPRPDEPHHLVGGGAPAQRRRHHRAADHAIPRRG